MTPHVRDLFGEIPVTWQEIDAWLLSVPRIEPSSPRAERYVKNWDVPGKIRRAKEAGTFEQITAQPEPPSPFWWKRMRWA